MSEFLIAAGAFLQIVAQMGTHVLFGTLGGIMNEKAGHTNLGIEGMMLLGAAAGFAVGLFTGNALLAVLVSGLAGMLGALIYAFITVTLRGNQVVTGLALTIFGTGVSSLIGTTIAGRSLPESVTGVLGTHKIPVLGDIPLLGDMLFNQSPFVWIAILCAIVLYIFYRKTRWGLNTRMVGENPAAADASGINVTRYKYWNILLGGFLCGIGGGFFSMVYAGRWQNELTAGAGWIAVALVIFALWNPLRAILGAYLFGAVRALSFKLQGGIALFGATITINPQLLDMLPYLVTILVLVVITLRKRRGSQPPGSLGNAYFREEQ